MCYSRAQHFQQVIGLEYILFTRIAAESCKGRLGQLLKHAVKYIDHLCEHVADIGSGSGDCRIHGKRCDLNTGGIDILTAGPNCPPYSKAGSKARDKAPEHPGFATLWEDIPEALLRTKAHSGFIEETAAFDEAISDKGHTWADRLLVLLAALGYSCDKITIDGKIFTKVPRNRS
jgi:site-specific DNA-cytosine methylase